MSSWQMEQAVSEGTPEESMRVVAAAICVSVGRTMTGVRRLLLRRVLSRSPLPKPLNKLLVCPPNIFRLGRPKECSRILGGGSKKRDVGWGVIGVAVSVAVAVEVAVEVAVAVAAGTVGG